MLRGFAARVLAASLLLFSGLALATNYPIGNAPTLIITAGDMSQASITSAPIPIFGLEEFAVQCVWNSTPTGTFKLLLSNDGTNYNTPTLPTTPTASAAAGSFLLDVTGTAASYFEIVYTRTAGSGTVNCLAYGKKS